MSSDEGRSPDKRKSKSRSARPRLLITLDTYFRDHAGTALDLGCGSGRDTLELLNRGWSVVAVDHNDEAIHRVAQLRSKIPGASLETLHTEFETLTLPKAHFNLVNASYSLPFCVPGLFDIFWSRIVASLKPGGIVSCEFFGDRDSWAQHSSYSHNVTFVSRMRLDSLLDGLKVEALREFELDGPSFTETEKHWHIFSVIARKPYDA